MLWALFFPFRKKININKYVFKIFFKKNFQGVTLIKYLPVKNGHQNLF